MRSLIAALVVMLIACSASTALAQGRFARGLRPAMEPPAGPGTAAGWRRSPRVVPVPPQASCGPDQDVWRSFPPIPADPWSAWGLAPLCCLRHRCGGLLPQSQLGLSMDTGTAQRHLRRTARGDRWFDSRP